MRRRSVKAGRGRGRRSGRRGMRAERRTGRRRRRPVVMRRVRRRLGRAGEGADGRGLVVRMRMRMSVGVDRRRRPVLLMPARGRARRRVRRRPTAGRRIRPRRRRRRRWVEGTGRVRCCVSWPPALHQSALAGPRRSARRGASCARSVCWQRVAASANCVSARGGASALRFTSRARRRDAESAVEACEKTSTRCMRVSWMSTEASQPTPERAQDVGLSFWTS